MSLYEQGVCGSDLFNYGHENWWRVVRSSPILTWREGAAQTSPQRQGTERLESDTLPEKSWKNFKLSNRGWKCMYFKLSFHEEQHLTCTQKVYTVFRWPNDHQHWGIYKDLAWGHGTEQREMVGAEGPTQAMLFHTYLHKINLPHKSKQIKQRHTLHSKNWTATRKQVFYKHPHYSYRDEFKDRYYNVQQGEMTKNIGYLKITLRFASRENTHPRNLNFFRKHYRRSEHPWYKFNLNKKFLIDIFMVSTYLYSTKSLKVSRLLYSMQWEVTAAHHMYRRLVIP